MKKLKDILKCDYDILINGITDDSREVKDGYLFVATKGFNVDHYDYIDKAVEQGAVCVVADRKCNYDIPQIIVENINSLYPELCRKFYDINNDEFNLIGITGTDGKTSTATLVQKLLEPSFKCAYIGTNGLLVDGKTYHTNNTTPCVPELYSCMSIVKNNSCKSIVMEVSSEALLHDRVNGLKFSIVAITNITEDHLNIHKTIENYRKSKLKIVDYLKDDGIAIVNGDDENCRYLHANKVYTFGFNTDNYCVISDYIEDKFGSKFKISYDNECYDIATHLFGKYNAYNITLAFIIGVLNGISPSILIERISQITFINGRGERLNFGQNYDIILDYAHTYNAILNLLASVKNKYKRVIVVTGAAGGREKEKRSKIGKLVLEEADYVIFTMDDPRTESVDSIIDDMIGTCTNKNYERVIDRTDAIHKAFSMAGDGDVVLVIGKGRDDYMALGTEKIPYCDFEVISNYFKN